MPYVLVIVQAVHVESARAIAEAEFDVKPNVAAKEFVPAASPTGDAPATHWWLATKFSDAGFAKAQQIDDVLPWSHVEAYNPDLEPLRPWAILTEIGLQPIRHTLPTP